MIAATAVAAALLGATTDARADEVSYQLWIDNTPPSIVESATRAGVWRNHRLCSAPTPYLRGDLDGDGRVDDIIQVARRSDGQRSLVVLWGQRKKRATWLGLHEPPSGDGGYWYVAPRAGKAKGEVVVITDPAAKQVAWDGKKLVVTAIAMTAAFDRGEERGYE